MKQPKIKVIQSKGSQYRGIARGGKILQKGYKWNDTTRKKLENQGNDGKGKPDVAQSQPSKPSQNVNANTSNTSSTGSSKPSKPVVNNPVINKPIVNKPVVSKPIADDTAVFKPVVSKPVESKPVTQVKPAASVKPAVTNIAKIVKEATKAANGGIKK